MTFLLILAVAISLFSPPSSGISIEEVLVLIIAIAIGTLSLLKIVKQPRVSKELVYLFIFVIIAAMSFLWAISNDVDLLWWGRRFAPILLLGISALVTYYDSSLKDETFIWRVMGCLVLLFIMTTLIKMSPLIFNSTVYTALSLQQIRHYGGGYQSAFLVTFLSPFIIVYPRSIHWRWRLFTFASFCIAIIALILSYTRTYWVATAVSFLIAICIIWKKRLGLKSVRLINIGLVLVFLLITISIYVPNILTYSADRVIDLIKYRNDDSFLDRMMELKGIWATCKEQPVLLALGHGLGAKFTFYSVNPFSWGQVGWMQNDYSHNYFAYLFYAIGLFGVISFVLFWALFILSCYKTINIISNKQRSIKLLLISIIAICFNLLITLNFASPLAHYEWNLVFGILVGIGLRLCKESKSNYACQ